LYRRRLRVEWRVNLSRQSGIAMESVDAKERDLAGDAQWKLIQKNCFTRWTNEHLKTVNKQIGDLSTDLADGLRLIALVEVLSGKRFRKYNKRPTFRNQKLENVTIALKFLEVDEGIKIVNIGKTARERERERERERQTDRQTV